MSDNFGYMFLFYDINEKRVNKVFKICKKYLTHCQNSVFRGEISPSLFIKLRAELLEILKEEDSVIFIKLRDRYSFDEEAISENSKNKKQKKDEPDNFL